ncbi:MAG: hypothetical protein HRU70_12615 [Phycisphaeraceae bacterium]|nr:MAG: hypothetical protein HRU70_12615 [Phycisphaeraceae bacterium]
MGEPGRPPTGDRPRRREARSGRRPWALLIAATFASILPACCSPDRHGTVTWPQGRRPIPQEPPPAYETLVTAYNRRVQRLERFWTPVDLRLKGVDRDGKPIDEDAGGYLQHVRPTRVALSVNKLEKTYFYLGANESSYWWFDLFTEPRVALVGTHERASPVTTSRFGLPVYPLDLIEVLGITPLPPPGPTPIPTTWAEGATVECRVPTRGGWRRIRVDPASFEPVSIAIEDASGRPLVFAKLSNYGVVNVIDDQAERPRVATRVEVSFSAPGRGSLTAVLGLVQPENRVIRGTAFDLDELKRRFTIGREISLDAIDDPEGGLP